MPNLIDLPDAGATENLARALAAHLQPGDCLLLSGPVGAGKSVFARSVIRQFCGAGQEVPSPSFALVQTYQCRDREIWHVDLYRLTGVESADELGLTQAIGHAITLIEWPEKLGTAKPLRHLSVTLMPDMADENRRHARIEPAGEWVWLPEFMSGYS